MIGLHTLAGNLILRMIVGVVLGMMFLVQPSAARDVPVSDAKGLLQALKVAKPGDYLLLEAGDYGALSLWPKGPVDPRFAGTVTIKSRDVKSPARISGLKMTNARNLVFENIIFDYSAKPGGYKGRPFEVKKSSDIAIIGSIFDGDNAHGAGERADGFGAGVGLAVRSSTRVRIERNVFRNFYRGLALGGVKDGVVKGNDISGIRADGMTFANVNSLLIEGNYIHDFRRNLKAGDHSDMIQFWTANATNPTTDVTIKGNILNMAGGDHTQSIFMRNEAAEKNVPSQSMFYRNMRIEQNVIINAHLHGITIGLTKGLVIRNNTLIRVPRKGTAGVSQGRGRVHWAPRIKVAAGSVDVVLQANIAPQMTAVSEAWRVKDNLAIQDTSLIAPGHYTQIFEAGLAKRPYELENFIYKADGPASGSKLGAARLGSR